LRRRIWLSGSVESSPLDPKSPRTRVARSKKRRRRVQKSRTTPKRPESRPSCRPFILPSTPLK
jgi:ribosomal protein L32